MLGATLSARENRRREPGRRSKVDAAYIGPTDLALSLGLPPVMDNEDPKHLATVAKILATCQKHNVVAGMHTGSSRFSQRSIDQGFQMSMLVQDRTAMANFVKSEVNTLKGWTPMMPTQAAQKSGY